TSTRPLSRSTPARMKATSEAPRFLRSLLELSRACFDDALTRSIANELARVEGGGTIADAPFTAVHGAMLNRVRLAIERPTIERLRHLWIVVGYAPDRDLRDELAPLATAWRDAR